MNKANLKSYAPKARLDFIKAVTERANVLGISAAGVVPAEVRGDVALIEGREWPAKVAGQRGELIARIKRHGFEQTMDEVAYTWFNRFAALRYMEIHDYLGHGWRVLSSRDGGLPEILRHAGEVTLPGLNSDRAREMQLAGNQDNELYKLLLVAQCNELSRVMPFLFERIDDETELLLPENLLRTDSIVAKLVEQVPEEDWQEIEVIGWLYQFYISEKKDQVIGKVVKSEDIPAATQLFTPNWIVQYLVQNSVGRLWLMANPTSTLANQWPYYIQPAEQTPEVQAQLDALIQTRIREDGETLNPETITVLDPACGSGHILVVAYDVLKAIYLERGYQPRAIPRLILEKNLYGLDIDDRAAQLAAFALLMKARTDDRRLFKEPTKLNVLTLRESKGLDADELSTHLAPFGMNRVSLRSLLKSFEHAQAFGSLIQLPSQLAAELPSIKDALDSALDEGDLYARQAAEDMMPLLAQAQLLGSSFDAVVANPPYMGSKGMNGQVKEFVASKFPDSKGDLYSAFIERGLILLKASGHMSMVTLQNWMFVPGFEALRSKLLNQRTLLSLNHIGYNSFPEINSKIVRATAFCALGQSIENYLTRFVDVDTKDQAANKSKVFLDRIERKAFFDRLSSFFAEVPGRALAYWLSSSAVTAFSRGTPLGESSRPVVGLQTGDNDRFIRRWSEVSWQKIDTSRGVGTIAKNDARWIPYVKGGEFRKWYGNEELVIDWADDGGAIINHPSARPQNRGYYFKPGLSYTNITSGTFGVRFTGAGFIFDQKGSMFFSKTHDECLATAALLNGAVAEVYLRVLCSTLDFNPGDLSKIPLLPFGSARSVIVDNTSQLITISKLDWDSREVSWNFQASPLMPSAAPSTLQSSWERWAHHCGNQFKRTKVLEEENNRCILDAYGFGAEVSCEISIDQIKLTRPDRNLDCQCLVSYAIGCAMGRYSLNEPGLIYAHSGNIGFDLGRYDSRYPADADGILPITDERWFEDDAAIRVREFLCAVWGEETVEENMAWLAASLGIKGVETSDESVRRYLADKFFKDHLQTYRKRPIYWLFSSGKQGAFQALVYLHRYNEGTLARMRAEYVVPLIAKMVSRLDMLDKDVAAASSAAARTKLQKQIEALRKKQTELLAYDERLRHYADMRISLDLDDGVKVNYAKFGDLVAESKAITGGSDE